MEKKQEFEIFKEVKGSMRRISMGEILRLSLRMTYCFLLFLIFSANGCALPAARVEVYKIGEITFHLYERREDLVREIKPKLPPMQQAILGLQGHVLGGHHDPETRTISTVKDIYYLLHELKHELEPGWQHDLTCGPDRCLEPEVLE